MYEIPCKSFSDHKKKPYTVGISEDLRQVNCTCNFWVNYGRLHNEPCKHIILVVTSIMIMPELLNKFKKGA